MRENVSATPLPTVCWFRHGNISACHHTNVGEGAPLHSSMCLPVLLLAVLVLSLDVSEAWTLPSSLKIHVSVDHLLPHVLACAQNPESFQHSLSMCHTALMLSTHLQASIIRNLHTLPLALPNVCPSPLSPCLLQRFLMEYTHMAHAFEVSSQITAVQNCDLRFLPPPLYPADSERGKFDLEIRLGPGPRDWTLCVRLNKKEGQSLPKQIHRRIERCFKGECGPQTGLQVMQGCDQRVEFPSSTPCATWAACALWSVTPPGPPAPPVPPGPPGPPVWCSFISTLRYLCHLCSVVYSTSATSATCSTCAPWCVPPVPPISPVPPVPPVPPGPSVPPVPPLWAYLSWPVLLSCHRPSSVSPFHHTDCHQRDTRPHPQVPGALIQP